MDLLSTLGRTFACSYTAGLNLYATVAILGFASRYQWVALPEQFRIFDNNWIIGTALALSVVEFVTDKIPGSTLSGMRWDAVHTVIRPAGAALIAVTAIGPAQSAVQAAAALAGAALASGSHLAKAGTRIAANTSPEPFSNWILSLSEDGLVVVLGLLP